MVITTATQKGGTGKTTTAATLAQAAAYKGKKALAVDLDPQGNLTLSFGADPRKPGAFDLIQGAPIAEVIQGTKQNIDVIPASRNLATVTSGKGSARRIRKALEPVRAFYDYIFIDTPAVIGELQFNALMAADRLIIPLLADSYDIQSFYEMTDTAEQIRRSNPDFAILGYILTMHDRRSNIVKAMEQAIKDNADKMKIPYLGSVRYSVAIKEAAALQVSIYDHKPRSNPAQDYLAIFEQIERKAGAL